MKRSLAAFCIIALILALLPAVPAGAAGTAGTLRVGYGKRDVTPLASTPLAGYSDYFNRMCAVDSAGRPVRMDDNGDGVTDEKDGVFATCIAVTDETGKTVLLFTVDMTQNIYLLSDKVQYRVEQKWGIPAECVILNASHTHSGVDLTRYSAYWGPKNAPSEEDPAYDADVPYQTYHALNEQQKAAVDYLRVYLYETLLPGLLGAAEDALADRSEATLFTGSITVPNMNFIRHYYQKEESDQRKDVYGDNTRGYADFAKPYAQVNDTMYLIRFDRPGKPSVAAVDWRGHPKLNSMKSQSAFGAEHYYHVSSDYINAFRYTLEQEGYRVSFFQGTGGNVNTFSSLFNRTKTDFAADAANPTDKDTLQTCTYNGKTTTAQTGPAYGKKLGQWALQGLQQGMHASAGGRIRAMRSVMTLQYSTAENDKMVGGNGMEGMMYETVPGEQNADGTPMNVYTYLKKYWVSGAENTERYQTILSYVKKYNINSSYHLTQINSRFTNTMQLDKDTGRYVEKATRSLDVTIYAFVIGKSVGWVSAPFELFDSVYDFRDLCGVTFVTGYTNGNRNYLPTLDTFEFAQGRGGYEANNTSFQPGTAEAMAARHKSMLQDLLAAEVPDVCPHCKVPVQWKSLLPNTSPEPGHYYLAEDLDTQQINVKGDGTVCLYLNGHTLTNPNETTSRVFAVQEKATLNLMGSGVIQSKGVLRSNESYYRHAGVILVSTGTALNLYGGTIRRIVKNGMWTENGGAVTVGGTMHMYGGEITAVREPGAADTTLLGGLVNVGSAGQFIMTGGVISGGRVAPEGKGDNLYAQGQVELGGQARIDGGICLDGGAGLKLTGAPRLCREDGYDVYLTAAAGQIDARELTGGERIGVSTEQAPQAFALVSDESGRALFRPEEKERYIAYDGGTLTLAVGRRYCPCLGVLEGTNGHVCTPDQAWEAWRNPAALPQSGFYYLETDVSVTASTAVKATVGLDLNGHTVSASGAPAFVLDGGALALTDSAGGGSVSAADGLAQAKGNAQLTLTGLSAQGDVIAAEGAELALTLGEARLVGTLAGEGTKLTLARNGRLELTGDSAVAALDGSAYAVKRSGHAFSVGGSALPGLPFTDVAESDWHYDAVAWAYANGIMSGFSASTFGPDATLSRAMVVQVLYNKEQKPATAAANPFKDIAAGQWYYDAVRWGADKGVVAGYGGGVFKPDDAVTLEQVAVILHNYSGKPASSGDAAALGAHSDWAAGALAWAAEKKLFDGMPAFSVTAPATRAQTAQMLMNYLK